MRSCFGGIPFLILASRGILICNGAKTTRVEDSQSLWRLSVKNNHRSAHRPSWWMRGPQPESAPGFPQTAANQTRHLQQSLREPHSMFHLNESIFALPGVEGGEERGVDTSRNRRGGGVPNCTVHDMQSTSRNRRTPSPGL